MRQLLSTLCFLFIAVQICAQNNEITYSFSAPSGWLQVPSNALPPNILVLIKEKGAQKLAANFSIALEPTNLSQEEYFQALFKIYEGKSICRRLADIPTKSGTAKCLQIDSQTAIGHVRQIQSIIIYKGNAYILTATSLQSNFSKNYSTFLSMLKSFNIGERDVSLPI